MKELNVCTVCICRKSVMTPTAAAAANDDDDKEDKRNEDGNNYDDSGGQHKDNWIEEKIIKIGNWQFWVQKQ